MTGDSFYLTFTTLKEVYSCKEIFFENLKGKIVEIHLSWLIFYIKFLGEC